MNTEINIRASIFPNKGVEITFEQYFEVSLDCSQCGRTHRTVIFEESERLGRCTPSGHEYPGNISKVAVKVKKGLFKKEIECYFKLKYEYTEVKDKKYPDRVSSSLPTWGRVNFTVSCPKCRNTAKYSMQNNIVRPWTNICKCGYKLYTEKDEYPIFSYGVSSG
ncbi:MAG: hypothetical protein AB2793_12690 [Candidatus Thiodiazotropha sp.]